MRLRKRAVVLDAELDLKRLWATVHHYLAAQTRGESPELSKAFSEMVDEHNAVYARYIAPDERSGLEIAGVTDAL